MEPKVIFNLLLCSLVPLLVISCQPALSEPVDVSFTRLPQITPTSLKPNLIPSMTPQPSPSGLAPVLPYPFPHPTDQAAPSPTVLAPAPPYPIPSPTRQVAPSPAPEQGPAVELPAAILAAQDYLARHLSLTPPQLALDSWEQVVWITPNLGCQPTAMFYPQDIIPGYRIFLRDKDQNYEIHTDLSAENICLAELLQPGERIPLPVNATPDAIVELARQHLAARLGLSLETITMEQMEPAEWDDLDLGCRSATGMQPDRAFARVIPGYSILLSASQRNHEYHSGGLWLVYCGSN
jgi:hypothetical protein